MKTALRITADQEKARDAYAGAVKQQAGIMEAHRAQMASSDASGPARMQLRASMMQQHATTAETMSSAVKALYDVLTPDQKTTADFHFGGRYAQSGPRGGPRW